MGVKSKIKNILYTVIMMRKEERIKPILVPTDKDKMLDGKVALITGGSRGIGLAIAESFLKSGAKVIIAGTSDSHLKSALANLKAVEEEKHTSSSNNVQSIVIDVRDVKKIPEKVEKASQLFEENRIDILVNSAGILSVNDFWNTDEEEYNAIMDTNAKGTFFMSKSVGKMMIEKRIKGHILNVTSSSALRPAWTPYQMSKWTVKGLTLGLADMMLPHGIVVNAIAPGPTATSMMGKTETENIYEAYTPCGRYAMPQEIASLAVFMVSSAGDMIVGDTFYMTGGSGTITLRG